jgi:hypothetical protein
MIVSNSPRGNIMLFKRKGTISKNKIELITAITNILSLDLQLKYFIVRGNNEDSHSRRFLFSNLTFGFLLSPLNNRHYPAPIFRRWPRYMLFQKACSWLNL